MSVNHVKWGILGTSFISEVMAKAMQMSATSQLVAIGSRSIETANKFAKEYSIPRAYSDYHQLLNDPDLDAVYIGLPNHLHKEWIIRSAYAGKHILCEKPFVINEREAREVIAVLEKHNIICMEALMYRYHPFTKKLQSLINEKVIGNIRLMNATYTANIADIANPTAGGSIRNLGCYPVSLVRLLANAEPKEIISLGRINQKNKPDNQASVILKFANHSMAVISTADDLEMSWQFDVYGTEGRLKVLTNPWLPSDKDNQLVIYRNNAVTPIEVNVAADKLLYTYQIDAVNNQILKNATLYEGVSLDDSLNNVIVLEAWVRQVMANSSDRAEYVRITTDY